MMPPSDAHDRTDAGKPKKKVIRKKRPPLPVPSVEATWRQPTPPRPKPPRVRATPTMMDVKPPRQTDKHLPTQFEYVSAQQLYNRALGIETEAERDKAQRLNQQMERERRREARGVRRRAQGIKRLFDKGMSPFELEGSKHLGRNQDIEDFIKNGKIDRPDKPGFWDYVKAIAPELDDGFDDIDNWAWRAAKAAPGLVDEAGELDDWINNVGAGAKRYSRWARGQRRQFREAASKGGIGERAARVTLEATDWVDPVIEYGIGSQTHKMLQGKDFNPALLMAEMALIAVPIKGLPSVGTVALRKAFGLGARQGIWGSNAGGAVLSKVFQTLGLDPDGAFVRFMRNSPDARRWYSNGESVAWATAARSRTGKLSEKAADFLRPALSAGPRFTLHGRTKPHRVSLFKNEREKWADAVARNHKAAWGDAMQHSILLNRMVSRHLGDLFKGMPSHEYYALRMVGKGQAPEQLIEQYTKEAAEATAAGDPSAAIRLERHISQVERAAPLVHATPGAVLFTDQAPRRLREIMDVLREGAANREGILEQADLLTRANAEARITAEQLWAYGARYQPTERFITQTMEQSPNRQKLAQIALDRADGDEEVAGAAMAVIDGLARNSMHASIAKNARRVSELEQEVRTSRDPALAVELQRLKSDAARGLDPDTFYGAYLDTLGEFSDAERARYGEGVQMSLAEIGHPFSFDPKKAATNLARRLRVGPIKHKNRPRLDENGIPVVGKISMEDRTRRLVLATPDPERRMHDARFYSHVEAKFARVFSDREIMAWLASQVGASPARGVLDLQKVLQTVREGKRIPKSGPGSIGLAAHAMRDILQGKTGLSRGAQAKISDFIDSALHSETRTWVGNDPRGGRPFVADRWSSRAEGLVDKPGLSTLAKRWGLKGLKLDVPGDGISEVQYEQIAKGGEEFTDHLNSIGFDGRNDWEPYEVQAMEWAGIQRYWGEAPEDISFALDANTRLLSFEMTKGPGNLGADLTDAQTKKVARAMEEDIHRLLADDPATRLHDVRVDVSGWNGGTNGSVHVHLLTHDDEAAVAAGERIARAFDQEMVQVSRRTTSGKGVNRSITLYGSALKSAATKKKFMKALYEEMPDIKENGWMSDLFQGTDAITIITSRGKLTGEKLAEWGESIAPAIDRAEKRTGLTLEWLVGNHKIRVGGQYGEVPVTAEFGSIGGRTRGELADPLEAEVRARLEETIALYRRGGPSAGLASRGEGTGRPDLDLDAANARITALENEIEAAVKDRANALGGAKSFGPTGGKSTRPQREWVPGVGRRGAIGGQPGAFIDDPTQRAREFRRTGWQNAKAAAERELIDEGGDIAAKMDELEKLRRDVAEATYPDWALSSEVRAEAERGFDLVKDRPGYAEAAEQIKNGTLPVDWLNKLVDDTKDLLNYDKWRIGAHLNALHREGGGGSLHDLRFDSVPGLEEYLKSTRLRGKYKPKEKVVIVGEKGGIPTILHELTHMAAIEKLLPEGFVSDIEAFLGITGKWTEKDHEDLAAIMEAAFLGYKDDMDAPAHLVGPLQKVRDIFLKEAGEGDQSRAIEMLDRMPEGMPRDILETLVFFKRFANRDMGFHGAADDFTLRRGIYMPEVRALPTVMGKAAQTIHAYTRSPRISKRTGNITPSDASLTHRFKASLQETGAFDENILKGSVASQRIAANIWAFFKTHEEAVKIGHPLPSSTDDIAVPVVPGTRIRGREARHIAFLNDLFDSLGAGRKLNAADLENLDAEAMDAAREALFMGATKETTAETKKLAEELMITREPEEGIVWVNRDDLMNTGLFEVPQQRTAMASFADAINDYLKASVLILKPSYIPMNMVGQNGMLLMQQGFLAPVNMLRGFALHAAIGDYAALIDFHAGHGAMKSIYGAEGTVPYLSHTLDKVADASAFVVDRFPRRAAFLYEASKMKYRTPEQLIDLLTNPAKVDDLRLISERTRNAMVDFDNLSPFEKRVITRLIFVYPWLKGATYWTARFPKDHPVQAMAYAYLVAQQQDRLQEQFPDGYPGYMKWYLPWGETTRDGKTYPYGLRLDQALTFLTPADVASDVWGLTMGKGTGLLEGRTEPGSTHLGPLYQMLIDNLQGYDSFTGQQIDSGLIPMLKSLLPSERMIVVQQIKRILRSDEQRRNQPGIYPTNRAEDWLRLFLGSLGPGPIDPEVAAQRSEGTRPDDAGALKLWGMKVREDLGATPEQVDQLLQLKRREQKYNDYESDIKREEGRDYLTPQIASVALVMVLLEEQGRELSQRQKDQILALDDETAKEIQADARARLGLDKLSKVDSLISKTRAEKEAARG